jgi:5-dehydro-2-deoxygluconokinase
MNRSLDVICLGRAAVDLYGQQLGGRLEDMQSFAKYLGGSSANLAVGVARLGLRASMLTRVGDEHMGRFVREALERDGVDVSHVRTDPRRLTGLVVLGIAGKDSFPHIFFRENCADLGLDEADFDERYIASSRALAITGTHLSTEGTARAVAKAIRAARANGTRVVLDIDYRPVLWGLTSAGEGENRFVPSGRVTEALRSIVPDCDLIVGTEEEIRIAGGENDTLAALRALRRLTSACIVVKRGAAGCSIVPDAVPDELARALFVAGCAVEVLNVLGAGDAFLAGFLSGWLRGESWTQCGAAGNACGALVVSRHGSSPALPSRTELDEFVRRADEVRRPDLDARIVHLHASTTTRRPRDELYVLAFDHRRQLEQLAGTHGAPPESIACFKDLVASAVDSVGNRLGIADRIGVIVDERHGAGVLARMTAARRWVGRPVEVPGSRPVQFDPRNGIGLPLSTWPATQVVKCLVFYRADDPEGLRIAQEEQLLELFRDTHALERELLIEIIAGARGEALADDTVARAVRRFYNLGIRPAWWKLEPQMPAAWQRVTEVIEQLDPHCNGVLLLGQDAAESELQRAFEHAAAFPICRGFAVGRSIFGHAAREWLAGRMDDEAATNDVAERYERLIRLWRETRAAARS